MQSVYFFADNCSCLFGCSVSPYCSIQQYKRYSLLINYNAAGYLYCCIGQYKDAYDTKTPY